MDNGDQNHHKPSWGARAALGGALLLGGCYSTPQPIPVSDTQRWKVPDNSIPPSQRQLIEQYMDAYRDFESATDNLLREIRPIEHGGVFNVFNGKIDVVHGIDVILRPTGPDGQPGECYIASHADPSTPKIALPSAVDMFDAYAKLCALQNQISILNRSRYDLEGAPDRKTLFEFIKKRWAQLPKGDQVSKDNLDFISDWLPDPFSAACNFAHVRPGFKEEQAGLKQALLDTSMFSIESKIHMIRLGSDYYPIPPVYELLELQKQVPSDKKIAQHAVECMLQEAPVESREKSSFEHKPTVLGVTVQTHLIVNNSHFGRPAPATRPALSAAR